MMALALVVVLLPGLALAIHLDADERDPVCFLTATCVLGCATAILMPWFVGRPGLVETAVGTAVVAGLALAVSWRRVLSTLTALDWSRAHRAALAAVLALAALRLAFYPLVPVAPGADMSMHSYTTRLILDAGGLPSGYRPLLPVDSFGASAPGLPTLAAILSALSGVPAYRGALLAACLSLVLVSLSVYAFVRSRVGAPAAVLAMLLATLAARDPQAHFEWGGNPTVLSLALATYGLVQLERVGGPIWTGAVVAAALAFSAAVVTHPVIPFVLVFVLPVVLLYRLWTSASNARRRLVVRWAALGGAALLILMPYAARWHVSLSAAELAWIRRWQTLPPHIPPGPVWAYPVTWIWYVGMRLGVIYAGWVALALLARRWVSAGTIREELLAGGTTLLIVVNALVWILPQSYALYPDRVALLLVPWSARLVGLTLQGCFEHGSRAVRAALIPAAVVSALVGTAVWFAPAIASVPVADDDLAAIRWLDAETPKDAVIENNYGDAGIWIPALAGRAVCTPHVNIIYLEELESWKRTSQPTFLYVGARRIYDSDSPFVLSALADRPDRYVEVFRQGQAAVFRLVPDAEGSPPHCPPSTTLTAGPR